MANEINIKLFDNDKMLQALDKFRSQKNDAEAEFTEVMDAAMSCREEYAVIKSNEEALLRLEMIYHWVANNDQIDGKIDTLLEERLEYHRNCIKQAQWRFVEAEQFLHENNMPLEP